MELALNLIWFAVVVASAAKFAVWSRGADRRRVRTVAIATVCVLALLFPIISITDDLHLKKAVVEEARSVALVPVVLITFTFVVLGVVHIARVSLPASPSHAAVVERGPPV